MRIPDAVESIVYREESEGHLMTQDDLPDGWATSTLGDGLIRELQTGFACGVHNRDGDGIPHLRPMNVSEEGAISLSDLRFVAASEMDRDERRLAFGDVLFNNTNSPELVGKTAFYDLPDPQAFSNHMTRIRCHGDVLEPRFCAMFLHQRWREGYFQDICNNHVSQASVSRAVVCETAIPLPPLAEQHRIVAKVEELLARVTTARDRLARVPAILKRFRQSVLAAACSGRLTRDPREPISESSETPVSWRQAALADLLQEPMANGRSVVNAAGSGFPVLRLTAMV